MQSVSSDVGNGLHFVRILDGGYPCSMIKIFVIGNSDNFLAIPCPQKMIDSYPKALKKRLDGIGDIFEVLFQGSDLSSTKIEGK